MGVLNAILKLVSRSFLLMAVTILVPTFIINPILQYFYPSLGTTSASSPLPYLEAIVHHRKSLNDLETELKSYLSPQGKQEVKEFLGQIGQISEDFKKTIKNAKHLDPSRDDYLKLIEEQAAQFGNFDIDKYIRLNTLESRVSILSNTSSKERLNQHFDIIRGYGFILDKSESNGRHDDDLNENDETVCSGAIDKLVNLLRAAKELTDTISNVAREIQARYEKGESVEDLDVSTHVENYDKDSTRLKEEIDAVVKDNLEDLSRTKQFISKATERVQKYFNGFHTEFSQDLRKYQEFYSTISLNLKHNLPKPGVAGQGSRSLTSGKIDEL